MRALVEGGCSASDACSAAGLSRATYYRSICSKERPKKKRPAPKRTLSPTEREHVLNVLREPRFVDKAPAQIHATLLDEDIYLCSVSTMYRILRANNEVRERRQTARHPKYAQPELLATGPNEVWSWDITKLKGPQKWLHYHLYVIIDIYSRKVVGWMVAARESADLAEKLIADTCAREGVDTTKLTIHSDRGSAMTSQTVAHLMAELGITKSLSRPRVSNDNCYSESQFKTLKYFATFPKNFGSIQHARAFLRDFFQYYNYEHKHSGIAYMTPDTVHSGLALACYNVRKRALKKAFAAHPERFVKGRPLPAKLPQGVWINRPKVEDEGSLKAA